MPSMKHGNATRRTITQRQSEALVLLFQRIIEIVEPEDFDVEPPFPGTCKYLEGYDDQKVATEIGCKKTSVETFRKATRGNLHSAPTANSKWGEANKRLAQHEAAILGLERRLADLEKSVTDPEPRNGGFVTGGPVRKL
jgi:hypothetical protein